MTHICVSKFITIGSDNGLSPSRRQAIIWISAAILSIQPLGTKISEILIETHIFSFKKMHLKMSSAVLPRPQCVHHGQQDLSNEVHGRGLGSNYAGPSGGAGMTTTISPVSPKFLGIWIISNSISCWNKGITQNGGWNFTRRSFLFGTCGS